jgi:transposase InsO family protein
VLGQHRSTQRKRPRGHDDEEQLTADIVELARQYGRYGYRKIAALLRSTAGWVVNDKRVERIWRQEGLKVPMKQPKRGRLWLNDGSCNRLRAEHRNHVWSYDFVEDRTHDGRKYRMLNVVDEFTRECLSITISRKLKSSDVIDVLSAIGMKTFVTISQRLPILLNIFFLVHYFPLRENVGCSCWRYSIGICGQVDIWISWSFSPVISSIY